MVNFGARFAALQSKRPQWTNQFVNYDVLKRVVNELRIRLGLPHSDEDCSSGSRPNQHHNIIHHHDGGNTIRLVDGGGYVSSAYWLHREGFVHEMEEIWIDDSSIASLVNEFENHLDRGCNNVLLFFIRSMAALVALYERVEHTCRERDASAKAKPKDKGKKAKARSPSHSARRGSEDVPHAFPADVRSRRVGTSGLAGGSRSAAVLSPGSSFSAAGPDWGQSAPLVGSPDGPAAGPRYGAAAAAHGSVPPAGDPHAPTPSAQLTQVRASADDLTSPMYPILAPPSRHTCMGDPTHPSADAPPFGVPVLVADALARRARVAIADLHVEAGTAEVAQPIASLADPAVQLAVLRYVHTEVAALRQFLDLNDLCVRKIVKKFNKAIAQAVQAADANGTVSPCGLRPPSNSVAAPLLAVASSGSARNPACGLEQAALSSALLTTEFDAARVWADDVLYEVASRVARLQGSDVRDATVSLYRGDDVSPREWCVLGASAASSALIGTVVGAVLLVMLWAPPETGWGFVMMELTVVAPVYRAYFALTYLLGMWGVVLRMWKGAGINYSYILQLSPVRPLGWAQVMMMSTILLWVGVGALAIHAAVLLRTVVALDAPLVTPGFQIHAPPPAHALVHTQVAPVPAAALSSVPDLAPAPRIRAPRPTPREGTAASVPRALRAALHAHPVPNAAHAALGHDVPTLPRVSAPQTLGATHVAALGADLRARAMGNAAAPLATGGANGVWHKGAFVGRMQAQAVVAPPRARAQARPQRGGGGTVGDAVSAVIIEENAALDRVVPFPSWSSVHVSTHDQRRLLQRVMRPGADVSMIPLVLLVLLFSLLVLPLPVLYPRARVTLMRSVGHVLALPFTVWRLLFSRSDVDQSFFKQFFIADFLTSLGITFADIMYTTCFYSVTFPSAPDVSLDLQSWQMRVAQRVPAALATGERTTNLSMAAAHCDVFVARNKFFVMAVPLAIRLLQCIVMFKMTRMKKHLVNVFKYVAFFCVVITGFCYSHRMLPREWLVAASFFAQTYACCWDVLLDFGFIRGRARLRSGHFAVLTYVAIVVIDVSLRFMFLFTRAQGAIVPHILDEATLVWAMMFLELSRRVMWALLRIETEAAFNIEKYRSYDYVPQPFQEAKNALILIAKAK